MVNKIYSPRCVIKNHFQQSDLAIMTDYHLKLQLFIAASPHFFVGVSLLSCRGRIVKQRVNILLKNTVTLQDTHLI